jgi:anti-sigma B factor antagonist
MKITVAGSRLSVTDIIELDAAHAVDFRKGVMEKIPLRPKEIAIDLKLTRFIDSSGLGALFAVYKAGTTLNPDMHFQIIDPLPHIVQLLELTQLTRLFEIVKSPPLPAAHPSPA